MCGIAGIFSFSPGVPGVDRQTIVRMRDTLVHRGPDGAGVWISADGRIGLGHRRLAVVDLGPAAGQPMSNEDGTIFIVFNGMIYNHVELRAELEKLHKHRWRSDHADTEVILHAYEEWGTECVHHLRGMFAFALWDAVKNRLWLVRDRIGIKPLYYSIHGGRIVFASEIRALFQDGRLEKEPDLAALADYISLAFFPAPRTPFRGVKVLPAGSWLLVAEDGAVRQETYWDVLDHQTDLTGCSEEELALLVREKLIQAIALHARSDAPMGFFLSGGIDSSAVAALSTDITGGPCDTFTIGYTGSNKSYVNEMDYARLMADSIGARQHVRILNPDELAETLPVLMDAMEIPLGNPIAFPLYLLSRMAREKGMVVVQGGEGADEIFFGYTEYLWYIEHQRRTEAVMSHRFLAPLAHRIARHISRYSEIPYAYLDRAMHGRPLFWGRGEMFLEEQRKFLFGPAMAAYVKGYSPWEIVEPLYRKFKSASREDKPEQWLSYAEFRLRMADSILPRLDKMSMVSSLECRVPMLDHELVELAFSLPVQVKAPGGITKSVLKSALRGVLPDEILDRRKQGLWVPIQEWYQNRRGEMGAEVLELAGATGLLSPGAVRRIIAISSPSKLWYLYGYCRWWKRNFGLEASSRQPAV